MSGAGVVHHIIRYSGDPAASPAMFAVTPNAEVNSNSPQSEFGCAL